MIAAAVAGLFAAASCQKEQVASVKGGEATVTLTVAVPEAIQTRAIAQAEKADIVYFEVWNSKWTKKLAVYDANDALYTSEPVQGRKANIKLTLVADQTYNFIFWAQNERCGAYSWETLKNVNVDYSVMQLNGNDDVYDAYYAVKTIKVNGAINETVVLYRPFAQLNFASERMSTSFGKVEVGATNVTVTGLATSFNTLEGVGEVESPVSVTFAANGLATTDEMLQTNGKEYTWVTMDYMFMMGESDLVAVDASFNVGMDVPVQHAIANVPLKKNYRTNIIGDLFAADAKLQIIIDQAFLKDDEGISVGLPEEIKPENGVYNVEKAAHVLWLSQKSNEDKTFFAGKTISFAADIDMMGQGFLPIKIWESENPAKVLGNGHKVFNFSVRGDNYQVGNETGSEYAGLFGELLGSISDLHVADVLVEGNYTAGALVGHLYGSVKNCSATNVEINSIPYSFIKNGSFVYDDANNVGGLIGYVGEGSSVISGNTVTNAVITGYRCIGGLAGTVNTGVKVDGNTVKNADIYVDQTYEPYVDAPKPPYAGEIVGRMLSSDDLSDNSFENVVISYVHAILTIDDLQTAIYKAADAKTSAWFRIAADLQGNIIVPQVENAHFIIDGCGHKFDGSFDIYGNARSTGAETLKFVDINFEHFDGAIDFITCNTTESNKRYAHNVTVDNCTFTGNGKDGDVVGIRYRQCFNVTVTNTTGTALHSLMQATGTSGVTIDNVTLTDCGRGVSLGTSTDLNVSNVDFTVDSYGIRADGSVATSLSVENVDITAGLPIVVRKLTASYNVALTGANALETQNEYDIVLTNGSDDPEWVFPTGAYSITGAEEFSVYPVNIQEVDAANAEQLQNAIEKTKSNVINLTGSVSNVGKGYRLERAMVFNMNNHTFDVGSTQESTHYALTVAGENEVVINDANFVRAGVAAESGADVVFNSGMINHKPERTSRYIFYAKQEGTTITIIDGTFKNDRAKNSFFWADGGAIIYVQGGTFTGVASNNKVYTSNGGQVIITGGTFNFDPTAWVAEGYQAVKNGSTWTVSAI